MHKKPGKRRGPNPRTKEVAVYLLGILLGVGVLAAVITARLDYVGLALTVLSLVWLGRGTWRLVEGIQSRDWLSVEGTIVSAQVWQYHSLKSAARVSAPSLQYRYTVAGEVYQGGPVVFGKTGRPAEILKLYPPGAAITVYYDPHHPDRAGLRRGNRAWDYAKLLMPLAVLISGIAMICNMRLDFFDK